MSVAVSEAEGLCLAVAASTSEGDEVCLECVGGGSHTFREQTIVRPLECSGCNRFLKAGSLVFGCSRCAMDVCEECHARTGSQVVTPELEEMDLAQRADRMSLPANKMTCCSQCFVSYRGFGDVCGACRKGGLRGKIKQCQCCCDYFQGFGASCVD